MMDIINELIKTFGTNEIGYDLWNPIVWITAVIIILVITYVIRSFGNKNYKKDSDQTQIFLSGNPEAEDKELMHIKGQNMYWGFMETLKFPYKLLDKMHTGNISDYILWYVIILGAFLLIIGVI